MVAEIEAKEITIGKTIVLNLGLKFQSIKDICKIVDGQQRLTSLAIQIGVISAR